MDELRALTKEERKTAYNTVFREAFPPEELKPLWRMEEMIAAGEYDFLGLFRDGTPVGYVCNWRDGAYLLTDYLCVPAERRSGGIGSALVKRMRDAYPAGSVFIGETEAETGDPARDGLILRRQAFYRRLGARYLPYDCALFGVHYRVFVWDDGTAEPEEVQRRHDGFYRRSFPPELYAAAVQIPLAPGEQPYSRRAWSERPEETDAKSEDNAK